MITCTEYCSSLDVQSCFIFLFLDGSVPSHNHGLLSLCLILVSSSLGSRADTMSPQKPQPKSQCWLFPKLSPNSSFLKKRNRTSDSSSTAQNKAKVQVSWMLYSLILKEFTTKLEDYILPLKILIKFHRNISYMA